MVDLSGVLKTVQFLAAPLFLLALVLLPLPWYGLLAARPPADRSSLFCFIEFAVFWLCYLTLGSLIMGHAGVFRREALIILLLASALPLFSMAARQSSFAVLKRSFAAVAGVLPGNGPLAIATLVSVLLMLGCITIQTTTNYDSSAYHIPIVYEWIQHHHFVIHPQFAHTTIGFYPLNWEALCAVFALLFRSDLFLLLPNLMAWLLFVASLIGVGRSLGASVRSAWSAALMLSVTPIVLGHVHSLNVDLQLAAFFFAAIFFGWNMAPGPAVPGCVRGLLLAIAMVAGIKASGPIYVLLAFSLLFLTRPGAWGVFWAQLRTRAGLGAAMLSLLLGGSWYLRNLIRFGAPFGLSPSLERLLHTSLARVMDWASAADWRTLFQAANAELGWPWLIVSLWAFVLLLLAPPRRRDLIIVAFALLVTLALYALTPYSGDNGSHDSKISPWVGQAFRYGFPFLGFLAVAVGLAFSRFAVLSRLLQISAIALSASALATRFAWFPLLLLVAVVGALLFAVPLFQRLPRWRLPAATAIAAALLIAGPFAFASLQRLREQQRPEMVRAVHAVLRNRSITKLTYTESHMGFVWYGAALSNTVSYSNEHDVTRLIQFMEQQNSQALGMGPNTIPKRDSAGLYAELLKHRSFRRIYGDLHAGLPVVFLFRKGRAARAAQ